MYWCGTHAVQKQLEIAEKEGWCEPACASEGALVNATYLYVLHVYILHAWQHTWESCVFLLTLT